MTPDRTAAAIEARRRAAEQKLQQVRDAIATLRRRKTPVTYPAVARQAGVSRTFLYANPDARALVSDAISKTGAQHARGSDWSPGIFVDIFIMLLLVPDCQIAARNPLGLSCRADVVSGRDCNIARCSRTRRS